MKKHLLIIVFTAIMAVSLTACGKDSETVAAAAMATEEAPESVATTSVEETEESEPEETTSEEETEPTETEPTKTEPTETKKPETKPTETKKPEAATPDKSEAQTEPPKKEEPKTEAPTPEAPPVQPVQESAPAPVPEPVPEPAVQQPPVSASTVYAPGSVDLTQCGLAGQEASIEQALAERVPSGYGDTGLAIRSNSIGYASHNGGAGSYTMQLGGISEGCWDLTIINRLVDTGDGFSAVADINCQVLQGMCNAICSDGGTLYNKIFQNWEGDEDLVQGEWKDYGSFQLKFDVVSGHGHFYIK